MAHACVCGIRNKRIQYDKVAKLKLMLLTFSVVCERTLFPLVAHTAIIMHSVERMCYFISGTVV